MRKIVNISYNIYFGSRSSCRQQRPLREESPYRRASHSNTYNRCRSPYQRITSRQRHANPFECFRSPGRRRVTERSSSPVERIFSPFGREISPIRRDEFVRDANPFQRDVSPFRRDANPFGEHSVGRDASPFGRDTSPFWRDTSPFGVNETGRVASPAAQRSSWFGRSRNGYGRNASPFERDERNASPGERNGSPFRGSGSPLGRDWSQHRRDSGRPEERECSLSRRDCTPPRMYRPTFKIDERKRWLIRRPRYTNRQLSAYYRKIGKLMILRRNATKMMKRSLTGEIRALAKLSRAVRGLPLNRKRMKTARYTKMEFDEIAKSDVDDALLNEPDVFEFID